MNDTDRLAEIRKLADAATPGPWTAGGDHIHLWEVVIAGDRPVVELPDDQTADAEFIAVSRTAVPFLLDQLEQARAHLSNLDQQHHNLVGEYDKLLAELVKTRAERDDANTDAVAFLDANEAMGAALVEARAERDRARATAVALEQELAAAHDYINRARCIAAALGDLRGDVAASKLAPDRPVEATFDLPGLHQALTKYREALLCRVPGYDEETENV